ncbi:MAG: hypothetical protein AAGA92_04410 [Planctomycetota bacterium]
MDSSQEFIAAVESANPHGVGYRLEITRGPDRYGHRLLAFSPDAEPALLLASIETDAPGCIALQALNREQLETHDPAAGPPPPALLYGMTGDIRCSLSIELQETEAGVCVVFDAAARTPTQSIPEIGSAYETPPTATLAGKPPALRASAGPGLHSIEPIEEQDEPAHWSLQGQTLTIQRPLPAQPATLRWRYRVLRENG